MATAQDIIAGLETALEGLGFTIVQVNQDHSYGPRKASIELGEFTYELASLAGDYKVDAVAELVLVLPDKSRGFLRRNETMTEFTVLDAMVALPQPDAADELLAQDAGVDFTGEGRRRITARFFVSWTQERG